MTMSSIGLPLLNGFIGEFLILRGVFERNVWWGVFAVTGIVLGAAYMLWFCQRTMFGAPSSGGHAASAALPTSPTSRDDHSLEDLTKRELAYFAPLIALVFAIGILPQQFILNFIKTPTQYIVSQVDPNYAPARLTAEAPGGARQGEAK
jgi:NADH-quinone oxidoreductase subunit M